MAAKRELDDYFAPAESTVYGSHFMVHWFELTSNSRLHEYGGSTIYAATWLYARGRLETLGKKLRKLSGWT